MNSLIAILGLAFLVLVHEAGHFYSAPRRRDAPEEVLRRLPAGDLQGAPERHRVRDRCDPARRLREDPGMHRPSPSDVDAHFGRAVDEAPQLHAPIERLKRLLDEGDFELATGALVALERAAQEVELSDAVRKESNAGSQSSGTRSDGTPTGASARGSGSWSSAQARGRTSSSRCSCSRSSSPPARVAGPRPSPRSRPPGRWRIRRRTRSGRFPRPPRQSACALAIASSRSTGSRSATWG